MNKKLTKLLSVFLIAGLIGAGTAVGVAGCKENNNNNNNQTQTEHDITWNMKGHGTAPTTTKTSGGKVTKPATDPTDTDYDFGGWFADDECTTAFDFTKTQTGAVTIYAKWTAKQQQGGGDDQGDPVSLSKEWVKADFDGAIDNGGKKYLVDGDKIISDYNDMTVAGADLEIESNSKKIIYNGEQKSVGYRVKFGGGLFTVDNTDPAAPFNKLNRSIKVKVAKASKLVVYGTAGTSNKTAYISLAEGATTGEGAEAVTKLTIKDTQQICWKNGDMNAVIFDLEANKDYYFGSDTVTKGDANASNANIYYIEVKSTFDEGKGEKVPAKTANCTKQGNVAHYYTKYGRYLDEDGTTVLNPNDVFSDAIGHKWTYTTVTAPTADAAGSVTLTCANDSQHTQNVALPKLTSDIYEKEEITTGDDAGKMKYTFAYQGVYQGESKVDKIEFVAAAVAEAKTAFVDITGIKPGVEEDYVQSAGATPEAVGNGTLKLTAGTNNGGEMGPDKNLNVEYDSGRVNMTDTESANILYGVLGFETPKTSGSYRVTGKLNATAAGNWDPVQIVTDTTISQDDNNDGRMLFALSSGASKMYCMRFDGARRTESAFAVNDSDNYYFRLDIDLDNHIASIQLSLDGEGWATIDTVTDDSINTFAGIRFQTGSGSRSFSVEQIAVAQKMEVDNLVGEYQAIERVYNYGQDSLVKTSAMSLKVNHDNTFAWTESYGSTPSVTNGTWTTGDDYYTVTVPGMGPEGAAVSMYAKPGAVEGTMYMYQSTADVTANKIMYAFILGDQDLDADVTAALNAAHYAEVEAGERRNPIVIEGLSETALTKTVSSNDYVYWQYKNTGDAAVNVTIVPGANTRLLKMKSENEAVQIAELTTINIAAGETVVLGAQRMQEATEISFVFRAYNEDTDGGVKYTITYDVGAGSTDIVEAAQTGTDGKLAAVAEAPTPKDSDWVFEMWYIMVDRVETEVTTDTVFTENTTVYAKWTHNAVDFAAQNNAYTFANVIATANDRDKLTQANVDGTSNAWLKIVNNDTNNVVYRKPSNSRIELNNGGIQVYFGAAGTLTVKVKSTGANNDSLIGLKDAGGYIAASNASALTAATAGATVLGGSSNVQLSAAAVGSYIIHGGDIKTVSFDVTAPGWYTLYSDNTETTRGIVVTEMTQTVNAYSVSNSAFTATSVELGKTTTTIDEQKDETITATITMNDGVYASAIEWSSEDPAVATVDKSGKITVLKKGASDTVEITLRVTDSLGNTVTKTVTVTVNHVAATGVNITTAADNTLIVGSTKQLEYEVTTAEGTATDVKEVIWASSAPEVATVSDKGLVTIVGAGEANITVRITTLTDNEAGFVSGAYAINITAVTATTLSVTNLNVKVGSAAQIVATVGPAGASGYTLSYAVTAGEEFATVNSSTGLVTGVAAGTATVTVTLNDGTSNVATDTCTVTVAEPTTTSYAYEYGSDSNNAAWGTYGGSPGTSTVKGSNPAITGTKLEAGKGMQLTATGFKATLSVYGFTTGGSKAYAVDVIPLDNEGNEITASKVTINCPANKEVGDYTGATELVMPAGTNFYGIKLVFAGDSGKSAAIIRATITVLS